MWYYHSKKDDAEVMEKLDKLAEALPHRGFDTYFGRIRQEGYEWNRKRVLRVYRKMKLQMRRKRKKRLPSRIKEPLLQPLQPNLVWSMDFMHDTLESGRKFRVLNILDDYNREAVAIEADFSFPGERIVRLMEELAEYRGLPGEIRCDNGPEFLSKKFTGWCKANGVEIKYIQPGKPSQNAYIERFNRLFREDVLDAYLFESINQVRIISGKWQRDYNQNHPHKSLGGISPVNFAKKREGASPFHKNKNEEICLN